jgi:hypothetical protein
MQNRMLPSSFAKGRSEFPSSPKWPVTGNVRLKTRHQARWLLISPAPPWLLRLLLCWGITVEQLSHSAVTSQRLAGAAYERVLHYMPRVPVDAPRPIRILYRWVPGSSCPPA